MRIDLTDLRRDHDERASRFAAAIAKVPLPRDWDAVRRTLRKYLRGL